MANYLCHFQVQIADVDGDVATVTYRQLQPDSATIANLKTIADGFNTAIAGATNGKITRESASVLFLEAQIVPGTTPPTDATYPSVTDGARLNFSNSGGAAQHLTIPAPTETTFLAPPQRDLVDPAGDAAPLIAFLKAHMTDVGGTLLNLYQGGIKVGRRARRRRPPKAGLS